ncbi:MAG: flagellar motor protein MotB, partial [Gammaproteobacteria bacterium]|nr:flagellar motor protein MotB [Gammaproteobacteria bacterium]
ATEFGEKTFKLDLFAAEPGTVNSRDEFRGTGGSLYYLRHQDILSGSDRLRIEVRDRLSGIVLAVNNLVPVLDYDIDTIQGRILLSEPLSASSNDGSVVDSGNGGNNEVYLVARYEYSPGFEETSELSTGGRVHHWLNDNVKLGATFSAFGDSSEEDSLSSIDITVRQNAGTWLKFEQATSNGISGDTTFSNDGGYSFDHVDPLLFDNVPVDASRVDASIRFEDLFDGVKGQAILYAQELDAGYSAPGVTALTDTKQSGGIVEYPVMDSLKLKLKADNKTQDSGLKTSAIEVDAEYALTDNWNLSAGVKNDERKDNSAVVPLTQKEGDRTDLTIKAAFNSKQDWTSYGFIQDSVKIRGNRDTNNRIGIGGQYRATERLKLKGELSAGELGDAIDLGTDYLLSDRTNMYLNYVLENERSDNGVLARKGNFSSGFKTKFSDSASIYVEEKYTHGDVPEGLTHTMGTDLAPTDRLSLGANIDIGSLEDNTTGAITERNAVAFRIGYNFDNLKYAGAIEYREDKVENPDTTTSERVTTLYKNSFKYQLNPDWRFIGKLNHSTSESSLGEFYDGNFTEAVIGYAYRPVNNDRLNALIKYTYFYNLPTAEQVTIENTSAEYIQKSEIVSMDVMYDISNRWSLGGKYAHRFGQLSLDRVDPVFFDSNADLYILRADWHFAHRWDVLIESRILELPEAGDTRSGALFAFYRHIKKNIKFGIGYNFTDFSDDLTDLDYDSQGIFINFIAKI